MNYGEKVTQKAIGPEADMSDSGQTKDVYVTEDRGFNG